MQVKIDKHDYRTFTIDKEKSHLSNQPQFSEQIHTRPDKYSGDLNTKIRQITRPCLAIRKIIADS